MAAPLPDPKPLPLAGVADPNPVAGLLSEVEGVDVAGLDPKLPVEGVADPKPVEGFESETAATVAGFAEEPLSDPKPDKESEPKPPRPSGPEVAWRFASGAEAKEDLEEAAAGEAVDPRVVPEEGGILEVVEDHPGVSVVLDPPPPLAGEGEAKVDALPKPEVASGREVAADAAGAEVFGVVLSVLRILATDIEAGFSVDRSGALAEDALAF